LSSGKGGVKKQGKKGEKKMMRKKKERASTLISSNVREKKRLSILAVEGKKPVRLKAREKGRGGERGPRVNPQKRSALPYSRRGRGGRRGNALLERKAEGND